MRAFLPFLFTDSAQFDLFVGGTVIFGALALAMLGAGVASLLGKARAKLPPWPPVQFFFFGLIFAGFAFISAGRVRRPASLIREEAPAAVSEGR